MELLRPEPHADQQHHGEMGELRAIVEEQRHEINDLVRQHDRHAVSIFGSVARGDDTPSSDIDFLVEFDEGSSSST